MVRHDDAREETGGCRLPYPMGSLVTHHEVCSQTRQATKAMPRHRRTCSRRNLPSLILSLCTRAKRSSMQNVKLAPEGTTVPTRSSMLAALVHPPSELSHQPTTKPSSSTSTVLKVPLNTPRSTPPHSQPHKTTASSNSKPKNKNSFPK